ncbi:hypothetical protein V8Z74_14675 [Comamonas sp. w2-DMI]|uniref:hypothetical protein n=1 Tax=Comamonas sp. w2-DMI TaxID=3126391 RepID=UPI0032E4D418
MESLKKIFWRITKVFLFICLGIFLVAGAGAYFVTSTDFKARYDVVLKEMATQETQAQDKNKVLDERKKTATIK